MKAKGRKRRSAGRAAFSIACLILGFLLALQMKNVIQLKNLNIYGNNSVEALQDQIRQLDLANTELKKRNDDLNQNLQQLIELGNSEDAQISFYRQEYKRMATFAGLTDVKGQGLIITIDSSAQEAKVSPASLIVLVNSLKASGVYAISINGQRVVALTEISATGSGEHSKLIMNGTDITNPEGYEVRVIGEQSKLQDFVSFNEQLWSSFQGQGCVLNFTYPPDVQIPGLPEDSPAYRQNLLETTD